MSASKDKGSIIRASDANDALGNRCENPEDITAPGDWININREVMSHGHRHRALPAPRHQFHRSGQRNHRDAEDKGHHRESLTDVLAYRSHTYNPTLPLIPKTHKEVITHYPPTELRDSSSEDAVCEKHRANVLPSQGRDNSRDGDEDYEISEERRIAEQRLIEKFDFDKELEKLIQRQAKLRSIQYPSRDRRESTYHRSSHVKDAEHHHESRYTSEHHEQPKNRRHARDESTFYEERLRSVVGQINKGRYDVPREDCARILDDPRLARELAKECAYAAEMARQRDNQAHKNGPNTPRAETSSKVPAQPEKLTAATELKAAGDGLDMLSGTSNRSRISGKALKKELMNRAGLSKAIATNELPNALQQNEKAKEATTSDPLPLAGVTETPQESSKPEPTTLPSGAEALNATGLSSVSLEELINAKLVAPMITKVQVASWKCLQEQINLAHALNELPNEVKKFLESKIEKLK